MSRNTNTGFNFRRTNNLNRKYGVSRVVYSNPAGNKKVLKKKNNKKTTTSGENDLLAKDFKGQVFFAVKGKSKDCP